MTFNIISPRHPRHQYGFFLKPQQIEKFIKKKKTKHLIKGDIL